MRLNFLVFIVFIGISCDLFDKGNDNHFERNPNLELLVSHKEGENRRSCFFPIVSPDGIWVYFLSSVPWAGPGGDIYKIKMDGTDERRLTYDLDSTGRGFGYIDISPSGNLIVASTGLAYPDLGSNWVGDLVLLDTSGGIIDTLETSEPLVIDPRFNWDGTKIYFYGFGGENPGIYRINPDGTGEEYVAPPPPPGYWGSYPSYEILENDSVITFSPMTFPRLNRQKPEWVVVTKYFGSGLIAPPSPLILVNREEGDTIVLDDKPYPDSLARYFPYWTPDGESIVFSVAPSYGVPSGYGIFEIWILKNVFEQVGGAR